MYKTTTQIVWPNGPSESIPMLIPDQGGPVRGYTIDELVKLTGYERNTIYNFRSEGIITPPIQGLGGGLYPSAGLYHERVLVELARYKQLKIQGMRKSEIIAIMKDERAAANG